MTPFPPDNQTGHHGPLPGPDFREALIQAMDDFANDAHPPAFDGPAILHRTRRRRALAAVTASAAAIALTAGTAFALHDSDRPTRHNTAAAPGLSATASAVPNTPSPAPGTTTAASPGAPMGSGTPSPGPPVPGNASVTIPPVLGMTQDQAEKTIIEAGLKIGRIQNFTDWNTPAGAVINTEPRPGTTVTSDTAVILFISKGKP
ncbi:PASTA domain-containing protein [Kitasatospora sp. NPDC057542]|uniref:PASTA domain-containing protein n=1 Tax=Streptomycetaceae TaxID=2062 RepID=UPI001CCA9E8B|nr:PASTA domain-containing protein [Streptomyces sp. LS1784]